LIAYTITRDAIQVSLCCRPRHPLQRLRNTHRVDALAAQDPPTRHVPAAFAAQDGSEAGLVPWDDIEGGKLAGSTDWKVGPAAQQLAQEALQRGLRVHMGRVNSRRRLRIAEAFGCATCDGTYLTYGPDLNLPRLLAWLAEVHQAPSLFSVPTD